MNLSTQAVLNSVLKGLDELKQSLMRIQFLVGEGKVDAGALREAGLAWQTLRSRFENDTIGPLPRHARDALVLGEDSIRKGWAIWFCPVDDGAVARLEASCRKEIEAVGGVCVCTSWYRYAPSVEQMLTTRGWEPDWNGIDVAIARVKEVFNDYQAQGRDNLAPTRNDIEAGIRDLIDANQPWWKRDGKRMSKGQFKAGLQTGALCIPTKLKPDLLRCEILLQQQPFEVADLFDEALDGLQRTGDVELFRYQPLRDQEPQYYCLLTRHGVTNQKLPTIPPYDAESKNWVTVAKVAEIDTATIASLRSMRSKDKKFEGRGAGVDAPGRMWRDIAGPNKYHPRIAYFLPSLKNYSS